MIAQIFGIISRQSRRGEPTPPPPEPKNLTVDSSVETFTAESPDYFGTDDRRFNLPQEPGMIYDNEEVILTMARPWDSTYKAYAGLWKYSSRYGAYPAFIDIGEAQDADNHLTPGVFKGSTHYHVFQENTHKGNLDWFAVPHDLSSSAKMATKTGEFSRVGIRRTGANLARLVHQYGEQNQAYTPFDGESVGTPVEFLTHTSKRIYSYLPFGPETVGGWHYIPLSVTEGTPGSRFIAKLLLKTQDWETFYNIDESESFNISGGAPSINTLADLADKWTYIGDLNTSELDNLTSAITCIDEEGNFYDLTIVPGSNEMTLTTFKNGEWTSNVFEPDWTIAGFPETSLADSNATHFFLFKRDDRIYTAVRRESGGYYKFHLLYTEDEGVSWEDLGDVTPGVDVNIYRACVPMNIHEIPDDTNFPICSSEYAYIGGPGQFGDIYLLRSAFGELKAYEEFSYTEAYESIDEFPDLYFAFESDDVATSGSTITQLNDKSGNSHNAAAIGSPQFTSGEIVCNGTNNGFQLNSLISDFNSHTKCTLIFVGRGPGYILSLSKSTDDNVFCLSRLNDTPRFAYAWRLNGTDTITALGINQSIAENHIYVMQCDGKAARFWIDGNEVNKTLTITGTGLNNLGKWGGLSTPNRVGIGVLQRSTTLYTSLTFEALTYANDVYTKVERMKAENFLAAKYGITINRKQ